MKGHRDSETSSGQISTLLANFSLISDINGCILMKLMTVAYYQVHITLMIFCGYGLNIKVSDNIFQKNARCS